MLEKMGDSGGAARLVGGPHSVPDHLGHDGRTVVGNDQDLQSIGELELGDTRSATRAVEGDGDRRKAETGEDETAPEIERAGKLIEHRHHHET